MAAVEVMGGTTADLDAIYDLADQVRRERDELRQEQEKNKAGGRKIPEPPWRRSQDYW
ncbi:hypothetical protein [Nocardia africana]